MNRCLFTKIRMSDFIEATGDGKLHVDQTYPNAPHALTNFAINGSSLGLVFNQLLLLGTLQRRIVLRLSQTRIPNRLP